MLVLLGASASSTALADPGAQARLGSAAGSALRLRMQPDRGLRFASMPHGVTGLLAPGLGSAEAFVREYRGLIGVDDPDTDLHRVAAITDHLGHTRVQFAQSYRGLPVWGSDVRVHLATSGAVIAVQAAIVPRLALTTTPRLAEAEAAQAANDHVGGACLALTTELVIFDVNLVRGGRPDPRLAYAVAVQGPGIDSTVFVDANGGDVVLAASNIHDVLDRRMYENDYGPAFVVWQESDGAYTGGDGQMQGLIDYTADTYSFFVNVSGGTHLSYDGEDAVMEGVLYAPLNCPNAQWDGVSTNYCDGLATDDVVAHEWAHGYSGATHNLIYAYQPGALNESYSDIFGESIDLLNGAGLDTPGNVREGDACTEADGSVRWLIGEDTVGLGGAIRDMWTPSCHAHPGRVNDFEYFCNFGGDFFDNGGVHVNSGVPNHAFALLVDGGVFNGESVAAIGHTKALAIYWRAMTVYQGVVSGFADHADALQAACVDLMNAGTDLPDPTNGAPSGEVVAMGDCNAVLAAVTATEMYAASPCGEGPLLDLGAPPALCPDDSASVVFEEDFEGGLAGWALSNAGVSGEYTPRDWVLAPTLPDDRPGQGVFGNGDLSLGDCEDDRQAGVMHLDSPEIEIPDDAGARMLSFSHWVATEPAIDGGNLKLSVDGGEFSLVPGSAFVFNPYPGTLDFSENPLADQSAFSGSDATVPTGSWAQSTVDLSALAQPGQSVVLRFDFGVNDCNGLLGWYVDDVRLSVCAAEGGETGGGTGDDTGDDSDGPLESGGDASTSDDGLDDTDGGVGSGGLPLTAGGVSVGDGDSTGVDDGSATGGDDGCSCRTGGRGLAWAWWALVLGLRRRR